MRWDRGEYWLTDEREHMDVDAVCSLLADTYWAANRPRAMLERSFEHSLCFVMRRRDRVVGFARAVTDYATFTWVCDVVVEERERGKGLGKWMVEILIHHPVLQTRSQFLATRDAHGLYERHGFQKTESMKRMPGGMQAF